jgi:5'-methylthioadenosine phosphorylase
VLGIIASSSLPELGHRLGLEPRLVDTPYGAAAVYLGQLGGRDVACLLRHGDRVLPPHAVNYLANIAALAQLGCQAAIATGAVGSLSADLRPPALVLPDQILDFTRGRPSTFFNDRLVCVDLTQPYCPRFQKLLADAAAAAGEQVVLGATYACMEGPRFETAAEIRMLSVLGADIVGMTAMPEAALAREKGICYGGLCVVTNLAAGLEGHHPSAGEVSDAMAGRWDAVSQILTAAVQACEGDASCPCHAAV